MVILPSMIPSAHCFHIVTRNDLPRPGMSPAAAMTAALVPAPHGQAALATEQPLGTLAACQADQSAPYLDKRARSITKPVVAFFLMKRVDLQPLTCNNCVMLMQNEPELRPLTLTRLQPRL
jgi:hypothetical protein